jgi:pyruvate/2-oxoacid:ferredoxin oxidoreductase alpha subunit
MASVAYRLNEPIALYPIMRSSTVAKVCDGWAAAGKPNLGDLFPRIMQMQSGWSRGWRARRTAGDHKDVMAC